MKRYIFISSSIILSVSLFLSCDTASELPPVLENNYATEIIVPDPVDLTQEERDYIEELESEYEAATGK